jgi:hypothetical protein
LKRIKATTTTQRLTARDLNIFFFFFSPLLDSLPKKSRESSSRLYNIRLVVSSLSPWLLTRSYIFLYMYMWCRCIHTHFFFSLLSASFFSTYIFDDYTHTRTHLLALAIYNGSSTQPYAYKALCVLTQTRASQPVSTIFFFSNPLFFPTTPRGDLRERFTTQKTHPFHLSTHIDV